jgi:hypothetical protein
MKRELKSKAIDINQTIKINYKNYNKSKLKLT